MTANAADQVDLLAEIIRQLFKEGFYSANVNFEKAKEAKKIALLDHNGLVALLMALMKCNKHELKAVFQKLIRRKIYKTL